jgi:hypothetical protein
VDFFTNLEFISQQISKVNDALLLFFNELKSIFDAQMLLCIHRQICPCLPKFSALQRYNSACDYAIAFLPLTLNLVSSALLANPRTSAQPSHWLQRHKYVALCQPNIVVFRHCGCAVAMEAERWHGSSILLNPHTKCRVIAGNGCGAARLLQA